MNPASPPPDALLQLAALGAGAQAADACRQRGGLPEQIAAVARPPSEIVAGVKLWRHPAATFCALGNVRTFLKTTTEGEVPLDELVMTVWAFAAPVDAYVESLKGAEPYLRACMIWAGEAFGPDLERLGVCAAWCMAAVSELNAANPTRARTAGLPDLGATAAESQPAAAPAEADPTPA